MAKERLLETCKRIIETKAGLGSCEFWTNREYEKLCMLINDETGTSLQPFVLKQLWAKGGIQVQPDEFTLDALARYTGFSNWKIFAMQVLSAKAIASESHQERRQQLYFSLDTPAILMMMGGMIASLLMIVWFLQG